jgi:hypothetical protein
VAEAAALGGEAGDEAAGEAGELAAPIARVLPAPTPLDAGTGRWHPASTTAAAANSNANFIRPA